MYCEAQRWKSYLKKCDRGLFIQKSFKVYAYGVFSMLNERELIALAGINSHF
jgi:hypothetical protein